MSVRDKWILRCCFASFFGSFYCWLYTNHWYVLPTFLLFLVFVFLALFFCCFVESMDSHGDCDGCYMLLSISYYVVILHDRLESSSSFLPPLFLSTSAHSAMSPLGSLFLLITVLIPLHGWRSEMNKLPTVPNRWQSPSLFLCVHVRCIPSLI